MFKKILSLSVIACFILTSLSPYPQAHADPVLGLPAPGSMVNLSPAYEPVMIKGLTVHKDNPFLFDFIVDVGQDKMAGEPLKKEGEKLIKYFLASLAIPDKDLWVNLSPYEKNKMIPEALGQTDMGRDLLEQDYILKQITASLIYPERDLGRKFWDKVYSRAEKMYGTTQIPVNTFNKVWIMADRAEVYEHNQTAFVVGQHLKVMLEEDYLALRHHTQIKSHTIASQVVRQIILPELEKEINTGRNFANLRQIFNSIILSSWYKKNLKEALLNQVYADKSRVKGINLNDPTIKQQIYEQYLKAYKKGVFNYVKEDVNAANGQTLPRKYFSGGMEIGVAAPDKLTVITDAQAGDNAMASQSFNGEMDFTTLASTQFSDQAMNAEREILTQKTAVLTIEMLENWRTTSQIPGPESDQLTELLRGLTVKGQLVQWINVVSTVRSNDEGFKSVEGLFEFLSQLPGMGAWLSTDARHINNIVAQHSHLVKSSVDTILDYMAGRSLKAVFGRDGITLAEVSMLRGDNVQKPALNPGEEVPLKTKQTVDFYTKYGVFSVNGSNAQVYSSTGTFIGQATPGFDGELTIDGLMVSVRGNDQVYVRNNTGRSVNYRDADAAMTSEMKYDDLLSVKVEKDSRLGKSGTISATVVFTWEGGTKSHLTTSIQRPLNEVPVVTVQLIVKKMSQARVDLRAHPGQFYALPMVIHSLSMTDAAMITDRNGLKELKPGGFLVTSVFSNGHYPGVNIKVEYDRQGSLRISGAGQGARAIKVDDSTVMDYGPVLMIIHKAPNAVASVSFVELTENNIEYMDPDFVQRRGADIGPGDKYLTKYINMAAKTIGGLRSLSIESDTIMKMGFIGGETEYLFFNDLLTALQDIHQQVSNREMKGIIAELEHQPKLDPGQEIMIDGHEKGNFRINSIDSLDVYGANGVVSRGHGGRILGQATPGMNGDLLIDGLEVSVLGNRVHVRNASDSVINYELIDAAMTVNPKTAVQPGSAYSKFLMTYRRPIIGKTFDILTGEGSVVVSHRVLVTAYSDKGISGIEQKTSKEMTIAAGEFFNARAVPDAAMGSDIALNEDILKQTAEAGLNAGQLLKEFLESHPHGGGEWNSFVLARISQARLNPGGIDLNTSNGMQWKVSKDGRGVEMNIDPAMIERVRREGIDSLSPVILKMTPVSISSFY